MKQLILTLSILFYSITLFAQQTIRGKVTDQQSNSAIPGVTISVVGSNAATQTNTNGIFELQLPSGADSIRVSFMGYESRLIAVRNVTRFLNIQLNTGSTSLNNVTVTGYNDNRPLLQTAGAISILSGSDIRSNNNVDILPALNTVSGVKMEEEAPGDFKISIRGSALRDPYGLRNIKLYWNDIPLTSPDNSGSHPMSFDPEDIGSIEIIKGPAGSIYGAGIGGVLLFKNDKPKFDQDQLSLSSTAGSFGLYRGAMDYKTSSDNFSLNANVEDMHYDGYRQNEWSNRQSVNLFGQFYVSPKRTVSVILNHAQGDFGIAGSVDSAWAYSTPRKAVQYAIDNKTGVNKYTYTLAGISQDYHFSNNLVNTTSVYDDIQTLNHPYGQSVYYNGFLKQSTGGYGFRTKFTYSPKLGSIQSRFTLGDELQYENVQGDTFDITNDIPGTWPETGALQSSQIVISTSNNLFAQAEFDLPAGFLFTVGSSYNSLNYNVTDLIPQSSTHTNYSGVVSFDPTFSPRIALVKKFGDDLSAHASISSGYSPPTTSEARNADGSFNKTLKAENGTNYEIGVRGVTLNNRFNFDVSVYQLNLDNAILPYYNANGSESYRNAGTTMQKGVELTAFYYIINDPNAAITLLKPWVSYTYSDYHFKNYIEESYNYTSGATVSQDYSGNKETGVTPNMFNAGIHLDTRAGLYFNATLNYYSRTPINDANTYYEHSYTLLASKIGYRIPLGQLGLEVFGGVNNMLNTKYSSWINFNADASSNPPQFYNPSPGINFYGGVTLKYNFKHKQ